MKRTVQFMLLLMVILCLQTVGETSKRGADSLAFSIHLNKSEYLRGEVVWLQQFIINLTTDTLHTVLPSFDAFNTVDLRIVDNSGHELPNTTGIMFPRRVCQQDILLPRDTLLGIGNLSYCFDQRTPQGDLTIVGQLPGTFTVDATYLDQMTSNTVQYSVAEPQGVEAEAFLSYRITLEKKLSRNRTEEVSALEDFLRFFPQSVYAPQALSRLSYVYGIRDNASYSIQKSLASLKRLIADYPNSPWCQPAFAGIFERQTLEENRAYFQSIVNSKPGTWAMRVAKNLLTRPWVAKQSKDAAERE